ncbi:alpha/beta hydrolase [Sporobolomyces salmoneus]|uniref:alpha/beta hydrolase n=1 Tax=Sporobolomyces salmoneus TaxID=183962 RepID=UPI00317CA41D
MSTSVEKHTLTYRTVRGLDIKLDYVLPDRELNDGEKLPIVVWFHGGGLLQLYPHLATAPSKYNLCLISADYRLAPQTRFPQILSDLTSLYSYILSPAFDKATNSKLDTSRIVTMGSSAGGWLSLLSGLNIGFKESGEKWEEGLRESERGVVGIYPITSVEHEFWHTKQSPVSYFDRRIEAEELKTYLDPKSDEISNNLTDDERNKMYTYMIQEACLQNLLLDDTDVAPSAYTVAKAIQSGKTVEPLPPIYLVYGTADDKVPHSQSLEVLEALREKGAEVEYEEREGLDHSFDHKEEETMDKMWEWVVDKLKQ